MTATPSARARAGTGEPQQQLLVEETIHRFWGPFSEGHGGVLAGRSASGMDEPDAADQVGLQNKL